jgi:ABC-type multidrug transport system permease subunit
MAFFPFPRSYANLIDLKGIPMTQFRSFVSNYSSIFALSAAIAGLYAMAIAIGCGIGRPV